MADKTLEQREADLQENARRFKNRVRSGAKIYINDSRRNFAEIKNVGYVTLQNSNLEDLTVDSLYTVRNNLSEDHNKNNVIKIRDGYQDFLASKSLGDGHEKFLTIRTREDLNRTLEILAQQELNNEAKARIWAESYTDIINKIEGTIPVTNSEGEVLTGRTALTERERLRNELNSEFRTGTFHLVDATVITTNTPANISEAHQQYTEWLITVAKKKSNWVVNTIDEHYVPHNVASTEQENALKSIEVARQKGTRAVHRAETLATARTAYDLAKAEINNTVVTNSPIWKLDTGSDITLTNGRHIINYTESEGSNTFRADNLVTDPEDAIEISDVSIDKIKTADPLRFTYKPASGSISSSYAVMVTHGGDTHPPVGNYDVDITARNSSGPSLLKLRYIVPDVQLSFPKPALSAISTYSNRRSPVTKIIQFDKATGGNGKITYEITPTTNYRITQEARTIVMTTAIPRAMTTYTCTATDEDGDTATQTVAITIT